MKIRDFLVIIFTAIVALLVLGRSALADGPCPMEGMGGACMDKMSGSGEGPGPSFPIQLVDWMCADRATEQPQPIRTATERERSAATTP